MTIRVDPTRSLPLVAAMIVTLAWPDAAAATVASTRGEIAPNAADLSLVPSAAVKSRFIPMNDPASLWGHRSARTVKYDPPGCQHGTCDTMQSNTFFVSAGDDITAAVAAARPGDVIELGAGHHGAFRLKAVDLGRVTLRSADPDAPAVFTGMNLTDVSGLAMSGLVFDFEITDLAEFNLSARPFRISRSSDISISQSLFDGAVVDNPGSIHHGAGSGFGLSVSWSTGITVENSEFRDFMRGAVFGGGGDITFSGNEIHSIRSDGLNFSAVEGVTIENNYIHDFKAARGSSDHKDMIQFWTANDKRPSTDIIIRNNILDAGDGDYTQSIFMRNEQAERNRAVDPDDEAIFYRNILIENNVIFNAHTHGIMVGHADGVVVRNNVLLPHAQAAWEGMSSGITTPTMRVAGLSHNVTIEGNVMFRDVPVSDKADWIVARNINLQADDPLRADHIDANFIAAGAARPDGDLAGLTVVQGSLVSLAEAGPPALHAMGNADGAQALFTAVRTDRALNQFSFDAGMSTSTEGDRLAPDAMVWDLGDGTTARGTTFSHVYGTPGAYDVVLRVTDASGATSTLRQTVEVADANILSFDSGQGLWAMRNGDLADHTNTRDFDLVETDGGMAFRVGDAPVRLPRSALDGYFLADSFDLNLDIRADGTGSHGELFRIHNNIRTHVNAEGTLAVVFNPAEGEEVRLSIPRTEILNGDWHSINIAFDGAEGWFRATVGDSLSAEVAAEGRVGPSQSWDLYFGNPWGKQSFNGLIRDFDLDAGVVIAPVQPSDMLPVQEGALMLFSGPAPYTITFDTPSSSEQVNLGRLRDFEDERALAIEVAFTPGESSSGRLAWNHMALGLEAGDDWVGMRIGLADGRMERFVVKGVDLIAGNSHRLGLVADADADIAQIWLDDILLREVTNRDIEFNGDGQARQWGWTLGGAFDKHVYTGDIHAFDLWVPDPGTIPLHDGVTEIA